MTDRYIYDAFGRTIGQIGSTGNMYLFAGEQRDLATGLDYLRARYLNAKTGRFFSMDPFEGILDSPITQHRFLYTSNSPVNGTDPLGLFNLAETVTVTQVMSILVTSYAKNLVNALRDTLVITRFKLQPGALAQENGLRLITLGDPRGFEIYTRGRQLSAVGFAELSTSLNQTIIDIGTAFKSLGEVYELPNNSAPPPSELLAEKASFLHAMSQWLFAFSFLTNVSGNQDISRQLVQLGSASRTLSMILQEVSDSDFLKFIEDL